MYKMLTRHEKVERKHVRLSEAHLSEVVLTRSDSTSPIASEIGSTAYESINDKHDMAPGMETLYTPSTIDDDDSEIGSAVDSFLSSGVHYPEKPSTHELNLNGYTSEFENELSCTVLATQEKFRTQSPFFKRRNCPLGKLLMGLSSFAPNSKQIVFWAPMKMLF